MVRFVRSTIESVLAQDYPAIEYIVVDGGSRDGSLEIVREYAEAHPERMRVIAEPDHGPADAIQKGLAAARGVYFAYLNADDVLESDAVSTAVSALQAHPEAFAVYGKACWMDEQGQKIRDYPTEPFDAGKLSLSCYICQPACFLRTSPLREAGGFDARYQVAFDYEAWLRLTKTNPFAYVDRRMAWSRMYRGNKTMRQRGLGLREAHKALLAHRGYVPFAWAHTYSAYLIDRRDLFFEPLRPSIAKYLLSFFVGTLLNWSSPFRYWKEWIGVMSWEALARRWNDFWVTRRVGIRTR
jgi:glycosyltransferase involved in cell wall biosynthesis